MQKHLKSIQSNHWAMIGGAVSIIAVLACLVYLDKRSFDRIDALAQEISALQATLASTTVVLESNITKSRDDLAVILNEQQQSVGTIRNQLGTYQQQVGSITGTVSTLQKLAKIDPELLKKYSRVFFLNENYSPSDLTQVPVEYTYSASRPIMIDTNVWPHMKKLLDAASSTVKLYAFSGHRSFNEQSALKNAYKVTYGAGTANTFSADQGYSEHQLGTTIDFITTGLGGQLEGFDDTAAYRWLLDNAHKYGFVLSYPKGNEYYVFEPWHWRFVGVKLATDLHTAGQDFYEWDQRKIDEYLVNFYD